ncbi:carboxypeptidase-like regulatory domain-containing protein [uncultured Lacinutrix sp.]|uniref:carboxypeptidase-like regulatory domain-containing protein n=1 Tax=uncultured Lacinutrix sp. TaxID=574032 RepID=UPI0026035227|nr:carboxypeptidase-like regulatory domain-containing protein [uncultured Lacinutrix sp.]
MKKNLVLLTLACLTLLFNTLQAQNFTEFKGKIVSESSGKSLPLADIVIKNTNISTVSNSDGEFALKVPNTDLDKSIIVTYLGYKKTEILLSKLKKQNAKIKLPEAATVLAQVDVNAPADAKSLVKKALKLKGENYHNSKTIMTAFYRETIRKRNKNASLSEAVLKIYKQPYVSNKKDAITLVKSRKNTNYSRLDTIALKLQGGPFSALYTDVMKYPRFIFTENNLSSYEFSFKQSTQVNNKLVYVVDFKQKLGIKEPMYYGQLYIDADTYAVTNAVYNLNVSNRDLASELFVRKKPVNAKVFPTEAAYRVNYRVKNGKWYYGYSNILLSFKVKWSNRLFNSRYTLQSEMAITDWEPTNTEFVNRPKNRLKYNIILTDETSGFADPKFWGEYNIIEPEKSIESAIKKISKKLKKTKA